MKNPDVHSIPSFINEEVVEIMFSKNSEFRAIITKRKEGTFCVRREKWDLGDWEFMGRGYWNPDERGKTLTDRIETARTLALEKLLATTDSVDLSARPST